MALLLSLFLPVTLLPAPRITSFATYIADITAISVPTTCERVNRII